MDATQPIYMQVKDLRNMWREVWWGMAGANTTEYNRIKQTDVFEYWKLFDMWQKKTMDERDLFKQKQNQKNVR